MKLRTLFATGSLLAVTFLLAEARERVWTEDKTGTTFKAEYVDYLGGRVKLRPPGGKLVEVPLASLVVADQQFVKAAAAGGNWPTWRGASRDGHSPDSGLLKAWPEGGPKLVWTFSDCGKGYSSPAIVDGRLYYTGSRKGKAEIICINGADGKEVWSAPIGDDPEKGYNTHWGAGTRGAPTVSDGLVYAINANGDVVCVSADRGRKKWSKNMLKDFGATKVPSWGYSESPLIDGDKLIVTPGGDKGAIVALDKKSGKTIWQSEGLTDDAQYASVIIAEAQGKKQYVQLFMKNLAGVDAETGKQIWNSKWSGGRTAVIPTPIFHGGHVYMTSGYGAGCQLLDISGGEAKQVYKNKVMKNHHGGVVLVDGHIYGFSDGGGVVCQNFMTGDRIWSERGQGKSKGAVHYADGMLYCLDEGERSVFLVEANPEKFVEKGRFTIPKETKLREGTDGKVWTHPVVLNGRLYLRDQDLVFCYDVKAKLD